MKNRANILNKINSFKNNIIEGKREKSKSKSSINNQDNKNSFETNERTNNIRNEKRNGTAICISAQRIKCYKHMKITAKNKDINNENLFSNKISKQKNYYNEVLSFSDKAMNKSIPKNIKQDINNKKQNKINTTKRNNSSNNILIRRNKSIGNLTKIFVNKNNENKKNKKIRKNTDNKVIANSNIDIYNKFQGNHINQLNQVKSQNNNFNFHSNISNNKQNFNSNNNTKNVNSTNTITIGNFNNIYNNSSNTVELSNRNYRNTSFKSKTKVMSKCIYNPLLDNNFINYNAYKVNKNYSKDKIDKKIKKFNDDIQNILIIDKNEEKKTQKKYINKNKKRIENEKFELNNNKNNRKAEVTKKKSDLKSTTNTNLNDNLSKRKSNNFYQYIILKGNASYLVKYCMYHRVNWIEGNPPDPENSQIFNFKWKELSLGIDYYNLNKNPKMKQMVNHFEFHHVISNKANLFINLMKYCEKKNLSVFKYVPFTIVFKIKDRRKIKNKAKQKRWMDKLEKLKNFIQRIDTKVTNYNDIGKYYTDEEYIEDQKNRNEFELNKQRKKGKKEEEKKSDEEKYIGQFEVYSDIFPRLKRVDKTAKNKEQNDLKDKEKEKKVSRIIGSNTLIEIPETHFKGRNMWVLKAINLNRGMCIKVVNSFEQMEKVINKFKNGVDYSSFTLEKIDEQENNNQGENINLLLEKLIEEEKNQNNIIDNGNTNKEKICSEEKEERLYNCNRILIQKYIESPLLYKGRKCDMRIWVLLTHDMKVYLFKEGHLKTCSVEYNLNSEDAFTHITNYSFQKHNSNFQKFEKGNEVPFYEFQKFIDETYPEKNYKLKEDLMKQIKEIIKTTMLCGKNRINRNNRSFQFEIFGYDFMMDSDFNVFLIEINFNPGLEISSPWIQIVVPRMLDDALRLTLDKVFEPVYDFSKNYKGDYTEEQKKLLTNSEIKIDFNAVNATGNQNPNNNDPHVSKNSSTQISSFSKTSNPLPSDKILNINLELDDFDKNLIKDSKTENDINININKEKKEDNENKETIKEEKKNRKEEKISNSNKTSKKSNKKKQKYISPFPVPGYSLDENLWEFICDLNIKEGSKNNLKEKEKDAKDKQNFTGIKHLLKRKKTKQKDNFE